VRNDADTAPRAARWRGFRQRGSRRNEPVDYLWKGCRLFVDGGVQKQFNFLDSEPCEKAYYWISIQANRRTAPAKREVAG